MLNPIVCRCFLPSFLRAEDAPPAVNLVNKDQLDILRSLRTSVSVEKDALAKELERVKVSLQLADDKAKMQMSQVRGRNRFVGRIKADSRLQVNTLLMEKVSLQSEGIGQRERMLEREREHGCVRCLICRRHALICIMRRDLKASLSGKGLSAVDQERLALIQQENAKYQTDLRDLTEKLRSAKKVRFPFGAGCRCL